MARLARALANGWVVAVLFSLITVFGTWPLASVMTTRIVPDVGDPVFNSWVMMWTGGQLLRFLSGDMHALADYWNGNIFYPAGNTIAFSEHLTPQMLQILPIYAATDNIILCYNLLFLSAIVLSALGMYLFVRELTGQPIAGVVAGLAFAFAPYRADQYTHLQTISTQWMPLALYGFQRYFATARPRALIGGVAAVVVQGLSCGYYLFFFTPFAAAFCIFEGIRQGAWRHRRTWWQLGAAAAVGLLVLWPFVRPYMAVRDSAGEFGRRSAEEVRYFSADTWALGTAPGTLGVWRNLKAYERPEGAAFPGATILAAGVLGVIVVFGASVRRGRARGLRETKRWKQIATVVIGVAGLIAFATWVWLLVFGGGVWRGWWGRIRVRHISDIAWHTLAVLAMAIAFLPAFRQWLRSFFLSRGGFIVFAWLLAIALAFGPVIYVKGTAIGSGPYSLPFNYVPGFDGFRVPARFFMVAALFLAALCGIGIAAIARRQRLIGYIVAAAVSVGIVYEGRVVPFITSKVLWVPHYEYIGTDFPQPGRLGAVYEAVEALPKDTVLAEFPFGSDPFEIRSMYFAGFHRKPLINGYSGFFPESYQRLKSLLENDPLDKPAAFKAMLDAGVTHVVVHEQPFPEAKGPMISAWIRNSGGRELAANIGFGKERGTDRLFAIR
jgi:hypothetical protein